MGSHRETCGIYTAEMLCVLSNPKRGICRKYSVTWKVHTTPALRSQQLRLMPSGACTRISSIFTHTQTAGAAAASGPNAVSHPERSRGPSQGAKEPPRPCATSSTASTPSRNSGRPPWPCDKPSGRHPRSSKSRHPQGCRLLL